MITTSRSKRTHHILLPLLAIPLLAACGGSEKAYVAAAPASVQTVAQRNPEFARAIKDYGDQVNVAAALEGAPQDTAIGTSIKLLADAVEKVPQGGGVNTLTYAELIRGSQPSAEVGFTAGEDPAIADIRSLEAASTALGALAGGPYRDSAKVKDAVESFQSSVRELRSAQALRIERSKIIGALQGAQQALQAMSDVSMVVPG